MVCQWRLSRHRCPGNPSPADSLIRQEIAPTIIRPKEKLALIHQYINNGYHIVLDVNSGSVHSVDALLYDAVEVLAKIVPDMEKPIRCLRPKQCGIHYLYTDVSKLTSPTVLIFR